MSQAPDGGSTERPRRLRPLLVGGAALLLLSAGFGLGRLTSGDDGGVDETTTVVAGGQSHDHGYVTVDAHAGYNVEDVVAVFPPVIVRDGDILDQKKGSPERALLEWWQAYQFGDLVTVEKLTSPTTVTAIGADKLGELVKLPGPGLQGIEVTDASVSGETASVNAGLVTFQPEGPGDPVPTKPTNSIPASFAMERRGGDWLFAETEFLEQKLGSLPQ